MSAVAVVVGAAAAAVVVAGVVACGGDCFDVAGLAADPRRTGITGVVDGAAAGDLWWVPLAGDVAVGSLALVSPAGDARAHEIVAASPSSVALRVPRDAVAGETWRLEDDEGARLLAELHVVAPSDGRGASDLTLTPSPATDAEVSVGRCAGEPARGPIAASIVAFDAEVSGAALAGAILDVWIVEPGAAVDDVDVRFVDALPVVVQPDGQVPLVDVTIGRVEVVALDGENDVVARLRDARTAVAGAPARLRTHLAD